MNRGWGEKDSRITFLRQEEAAGVEVRAPDVDPERAARFISTHLEGEIIDEEALLAALVAGTLWGVALDVYVGEFEHAPDRRLWDDARVLITPHISGGSDQRQHREIDLFCDNLRAYLDGRPLSNVVDWAEGY
jgi:hypothetical protein